MLRIIYFLLEVFVSLLGMTYMIWKIIVILMKELKKKCIASFEVCVMFNKI